MEAGQCEEVPAQGLQQGPRSRPIHRKIQQNFLQAFSLRKQYYTLINSCYLFGSFVVFTVSVADPGWLSRIPDPTFFHPGSQIHIQEFKYFNPKNSRNYDPVCSSRIRILIFSPSRIPDLGSRGQKCTGSRITNPVPQHFTVHWTRLLTGLSHQIGSTFVDMKG